MKVCRNCMVFFNDDVETCTKCGLPTAIVGENNTVDTTYKSSEQYPYECPVCQKEYKQESLCSCGLKAISKNSCKYKFFPTAIIIGVIAVTLSILFICSLSENINHCETMMALYWRTSVYDEYSNIKKLCEGLTTLTGIAIGAEVLFTIYFHIKSRHQYKYNLRQQKLLIQIAKNSKK